MPSPEPVPDPDQPVVRTFFVSQNPLAPMPAPAGLRVRLCAAGQAGGDIECSSPVFEAFADASSLVRIKYPAPQKTTASVARVLDAFLETTDSLHDPPLVVPGVLVPVPPLQSNAEPEELAVLTPDQAIAFAALAGDVIDDIDSYSGVLVLLYDCRVSDRMRAVGATFAVTSAPEVKLIYGFDPANSVTTADRVTSGTAGATMVPPGFATITASYQGELVARKVGVPVRAGASTAVYLVPH